eukprot:4846172-Amphidinium_carterae.2
MKAGLVAHAISMIGLVASSLLISHCPVCMQTYPNRAKAVAHRRLYDGAIGTCDVNVWKCIFCGFWVHPIGQLLPHVGVVVLVAVLGLCHADAGAAAGWRQGTIEMCHGRSYGVVGIISKWLMVVGRWQRVVQWTTGFCG